VAAVAGKRPFLPFHKNNFEKTAICGILRFYFSELGKVLFCCHCCHQQKHTHLLINILQNTINWQWCRWCTKKEFFQLPEK